MVVRRSLISCLVVASCLAMAGDTQRTLASSLRQSSGADQPLPGLEKLQEWLALVERHVPGKVDGPVVALITWPPEDLQVATVDLKELLRLLAEARSRFARTGQWPTIKYRDRLYTPTQIAQVLGGRSAVAQRDPNLVLKRAALLMTDVALRASSQPVAAGSRRPAPGSSYILQMADGSFAGLEGASIFWTEARSLLDGVKPDPWRDADVLRWYVTTVEYLHGRLDLANAQWQLEHARELIDDDADIQFQSGFLEETLAAGLFNVELPPFVPEAARRNRPGADTRWQQAASYLQKALRIDPGLAEARLRLGRVIGLRGRHTEALTELERVLPALPSDRLRYYAHLFLGAEQAALGRRDAARADYDRAAALFPFAQSPRLAQSALARRYGDRRGALDAIQGVLRLPGDESQRPDPWWQYHFPVRSEAAARLAALYAAWPAKEQP